MRMLSYDTPLYRPPSEARSVIFQVTLGCSFNECSFCDMYRSKEYEERPWEAVREEIDMMARYQPDARRFFLADGDALNLDTEYMTKITGYIREKFADAERISCYAMPMNILKKSEDDLRRMKEAGLDMLYLGIESGSDVVLKKVTKGAIAKTIIKSVNKAKAGRVRHVMHDNTGARRHGALKGAREGHGGGDQRLRPGLRGDAHAAPG